MTVDFDWDGDTWGLNDLYAHRPYVPSIEFDAWWELHSTVGEERLRRINKIASPEKLYLAPPLYELFLGSETMAEDFNWITRFNMDAFADRMGGYYTSSVAWMIAKAIGLDRYDEIKLPGVDMVTKEEYFKQRSCIEYWIGRAEAQGITVKTMANSTLMKGEKYPASRSEG